MATWEVRMQQAANKRERMGKGPKLKINKLTKAKVKQQLQQQASAVSSGTQTPPPPPPQRESVRNLKFLWPLLVAIDVAAQGYLFMMRWKGDDQTKDGVPNVPSASVTTEITAVDQKPLGLYPVADPVKLREQIPEDEQRELFRWLLEEKRKMKPKDAGEKKRIDEEKAILKQFIRAMSIPSL